jgi:preprotein translocase subunit SecF
MLKSLFKVYEKEYKKLLFIPIIILIFSLSIIIYTKASTGEFFKKDISLKGGTSMTVYTNNVYDLDELTLWAKNEWSLDSSIIHLIDPITGLIIGYEFRTSLELSRDEVTVTLGDKLGFELNNDNFNMGVQSALVASNFFTDSLLIILISFILMTCVTFYYFRSPLPSFSIILSTIADVINIIAVLNLIGASVSVASIGALLMLIAYSTDSDILLASNIIKRREGSLIKRLKRSLRTELTMSVAAITTYSIMFMLTNIELIKSISLVLLIGSVSDVLNTYVLSAGLQRIYLGRKNK